jgi:hypothetical protein
LEKGEYQLLIGDDASGRVPTWIMRKIIGEIYQEKGFPPIETVYIAGSGSSAKNANIMEEEGQEKKEKIGDFINYLRKGKESQKMRLHAPLSRVLIVTDTVYTGTSLDPLTEVLKENGIPFDVAAIGLEKTHSGDKGYRFGQKIIYGQEEIPSIDGASHLSGVGKYTRQLFAHPRNRVFASKDVQKTTVELSREDASRLAKEIIEKYRQERV